MRPCPWPLSHRGRMPIIPSRSFALALSALAALSATAGAQRRADAAHRRTMPVDSGAHVRVTTTIGRQVEGTLSARPGATLLIRRVDSTGAALPDTAITTSDISTLDRKVARRYAARGFGIGAGVGAIAGLAAAADGCATATGESREMCGLGYIIGPPLFAAIGSVVGTVVGALTVGDSWKPAHVVAR